MGSATACSQGSGLQCSMSTLTFWQQVAASALNELEDDAGQSVLVLRQPCHGRAALAQALGQATPQHVGRGFACMPAQGQLSLRCLALGCWCSRNERAVVCSPSKLADIRMQHVAT